MYISKYVETEVEVNVELEDFDFGDICQYIVEINNGNPTNYEIRKLDHLKKNLLIPEDMKDRVHAMERNEFNELFAIMKNSWQALT